MNGKLPETDGLLVGKSLFLEGQFGVITKKHYKKGEVIFVVEGITLHKPTKYSFSIDLYRHIEPLTRDGFFDFGHYLNHSCDPNVIIRAQEDKGNLYLKVVAREDIKEGEELTFDYASLEYDVTIADSVCKCRKPKCRGKVQGFKDLPADVFEQYKKEGMIANYLLNVKIDK